MKLPNGYGSVYKLPGKRRCPYRAIVTLNCNPGFHTRYLG